MFRDLTCDVRQNFVLKDIMTMGVGGPCPYYITPDRPEQLEIIYSRCREAQMPLLLVGNGSNILMDDNGFPGVAVHTGKRLRSFNIEGDTLYADSGVQLPKLAISMAMAGITGFEFMAGIPGTVGGAIVMNAGCLGKETSSVLKSVTYLDEEGKIQVRKAEELGLSFRSSSLKGRQVIILEAAFHIQYAESKDEVAQKTKQASEIRKNKFPINVSTLGSTFKSPPEGPHPGKLIEEVGLKGHRIGGAEISRVHANWIINLGTAKAKDVKELIHVMQNKVAQQLGITMEPEVLFV